MQIPRRKIDMYQVVVPDRTRTKLLHDRNEVVGCGPVYCKECGLFFDHKHDNVCDFDQCSRHRCKKGYRLLDILK